MSAETLSILRESIVTDDILILATAICELIALVAVIFFARSIEKQAKKWEQNRNTKFSGWMYLRLRFCHTFYLSTLTLFPLLGMLGTVNGLLGLDLATGDMENIRANFFIALTSTAWGIIFSVFFKFIYAFLTDWVEDQIEVSKRLSEEVKIRKANRRRGSYEET